MINPRVALSSALNLRPGDARTLIVLGGYLFLLTATTTLLMAVKNGLFLSEYPPEWIPYAMIAGAVVTAFVSVVFSAFTARARSRDGLAGGFLRFMAASLFLCWVAFAMYPRSAFAIYLWLETCGILLLIQGWSYVGDSLTTRQGKRLMPLIGIGGSGAAILTGFGLAPLAPFLGTENLLLLASALIWSALSLLGHVETPEEDGGESIGADIEFERGIAGFVRSSGKGFRILAQQPLLKLLAVAVVLVMVTSTLIDFQFKIEVQRRFGKDEIATFYGLLLGAVGVASLVLQLTASRVIFPKFGISTAAMGHAGTLALNAGAVAVLGGLPVLFLLQVMDDSLRNSIEKPAKQVSLLPFPRRVKGPAYTTIGGVLRPAASALTAAAAILMTRQPASLPVATAIAAAAAMLVYTRHRRLYLAALEEALARRFVDMGSVSETPLVVDRTALGVIDRALADDEPMVLVFAVSLLARVPSQDALPRILPLLEHERKEVRTEAAKAIARLDEGRPDIATRGVVLRRLELEESAMALSALLGAMQAWTGEDVDASLATFLKHPSVEVQKGALLTLGRRGWNETGTWVAEMLVSERPRDPGRRVQGGGPARSRRFSP